jgi:uncharacterized protein with ParB-like and HNH nuclease domain/predicted transport protein
VEGFRVKATEAKLLDFLQSSKLFRIPIYQRTYSWGEAQCRRLWDDILAAGANDDVSGHFVGSIVYVEEGLSQVSWQAPLLVIDGQQRLTTLSLLIEALARAVGDEEPVDGFSAKKLRSYYLRNDLEDGDRYFKLVLSETDSDTLKAIIRGAELPPQRSIRIDENFQFFCDEIETLGGDFEALCHGLAKLLIVDVTLSRGQDNPQLIFESMNSTGKDLTQADLIRNFILMGLEPDLQERLYRDYWRPMELDFGQQAYGTQFDGFMRNFLTVRTGAIPRKSEVYDAFKSYSTMDSVKSQGTETLVKDIRTFAGYFCEFALGKNSAPALQKAFADLRRLGRDVTHPLLLELSDDHANGLLVTDDYVRIVRLIESYILRRAICDIPTNTLKDTFATFGKNLDKAVYLESVEAKFQLLASRRRFPKDEEFTRELETSDLYSRKRIINYLFDQLENHDRKEKVSTVEYSIEHIMPQNPDLADEWKADLGPDWQSIHERLLHTLGNLTLTGYNSEYSDKPFLEKRDMENGFKHSPLRLNRGLGQLDTWNETTIVKRAAELSAAARSIWVAPNLDVEILAKHQPKRTRRPSEYTIDDHPFLALPEIRQLFEALRSGILELEPEASEEFMKLYVAYKTDTNFVDVVPQRKRLRLSLNMPFSAIKDPKGWCKDISGVGRWGNGDVEVGMSSLEELPYLLDLIRQSLEHQVYGADDWDD